jgi:uncharacterized protein YukE
METAIETAAVETSVSPQSLPDDFDINKWAAEQDAATDGQPASQPETVETKGPETKGPEADTNKTGEESAKPGEQGKPEDAKPREEGKPETAYAKAQKEAERRDRSWKALEQEKSEFRQERTQLQSQLENLKREVQQLRTASAGPAKDEHGATAETYDRLARKYRDEGNDDMAEAAQARAENLRRQTPVADVGGPASPGSPEFQQQWQRTTKELIAAEPALGDPNNPIVKAANTLLSDQTWAGFFTTRPDGIRAAVEVARLIERSSRLDVMQKELDAAKAEAQRLTKLTAPRGGHPSAPPNGAKRIEDMNDDEAQREIMRIASAADRGEL